MSCVLFWTLITWVVRVSIFVNYGFWWIYHFRNTLWKFPILHRVVDWQNRRTKLDLTWLRGTLRYGVGGSMSFWSYFARIHISLSSLHWKYMWTFLINFRFFNTKGINISDGSCFSTNNWNESPHTNSTCYYICSVSTCRSPENYRIRCN